MLGNTAKTHPRCAQTAKSTVLSFFLFEQTVSIFYAFVTVVTCNAVLAPANGHLTCADPLGKFSFHSSCNVSCDEGYKFRGKATLTCLSTLVLFEQQISVLQRKNVQYIQYILYNIYSIIFKFYLIILINIINNTNFALYTLCMTRLGVTEFLK